MRFAIRLLVPRLGLGLFTLFVVSLIIFWAVEWLPGDPATRILGRAATEERAAILRERLHLDEPPLTRYLSWLGGFVQGDWGESIVAQRPVFDYVFPRLKNTVILAVFAMLIYIPASVILGIVTAVYRNRGWAIGLSVIVLIGTAIPEFVIGILLVLVFAVTLPIFPPLALMDQVESFGDLIQTLFLPTLTLALAMTAYAVRMMQTSLIAVLESEYVRTAILKGLTRKRVIFYHALPNALGPALRVTALNIAWLIGGVVLVEVVFNFPGLGRLLVDSIRVLDTPVVLAIALLMAGVYILANLGADLVSGLLNPRVRAG